MITSASVGDLTRELHIVQGFALCRRPATLTATREPPPAMPGPIHPTRTAPGPAGSSKRDLSPVVTANGG
jgi:hypothetical protein